MRLRRLALILAVGAPLLFLLAWAAVNAWLESSGGRQQLERELEDRLGMPVELGGSFDVMLLPSLGASGTGLVVGGSQGGEPFAVGDEYEITVALRPLFDRRILIESVRLKGGRVIPERYERRAGREDADAETATDLPEIEQFILEGVDLRLGRSGGAPVRVRRLVFSEFAAGRRTGFELLLERIGRIHGWITVDPGGDRAELEAAWEAPDVGDVSLHGRFDFASRSGRVETKLTLDGRTAGMEAGFRQDEGGLLFPDMAFDLGGQSVAGTGCLLFTDPPGLRLRLAADLLDADKLAALIPAAQGSGDAASWPSAGQDLPFDLGLRLAVAEWRGQGAVLRDTLLTIGGPADCPGAAPTSAVQGRSRPETPVPENQ
jgi:hypothetical protein